MSEGTHSKYSPSQLPRIIRCPGSALMHKSQSSSSFAIEGTLCHEVTADHLEKQTYDVDLTHPIVIGFDDDKRNELVDAIQQCLDFSRGIIEANDDAQIKIESHVTMAGFAQKLCCPGLKDVAGTVDLYIIVPSQHILYVIDWKYGAGIEVWPDSEQILAYGTAAMEDIVNMKKYDEIHMFIGQPRLYSGTKFKEHVLRPTEMLEWATNTLAPAINKCEAGTAEFNPSEKACQWCSHKMRCEHRLKQANLDAASIFAAYTNLPNEVTIEQLLEFRAAAASYKKYIADVEKHIYKEAMQGKTLPGLKVVRGKSIRKWVDTKAFVLWADENVPDEDIFEVKPLSPAKAEKLLKKRAKEEDFQALIYKPEGAPTIVLEKDARPAIKFGDATDVFKEFV